ncbi:MAG: TniB family NTP-binding protein, partial [Ktedonobacteraceae bacterium]|nr:TniB family NTP-binding protein [Ktedonobacteraceae bacterium]
KIKHAALKKMDDMLMNAIDEHTSYSILALYGPSGVGKSTVMKRIVERRRAEAPDPARVPVVMVQASPEDVGSAARLDFYRQVLQQLRGHVAVRDRILNLPLANVRAKKSTDPAEWLEMRDAVLYALDLLKVQAVCIDEAQHLMQADAAQKPSIQLDWLKSLTNQSQLLYILVGNFSLYDFCHLNGQLARRVREEQFCRYHLGSQADAVEFTSALKVLLEQVPLQVNIPEMLMHWKWFGEWSIGCIGILSDWVVETASTLCRAGETVLALEALAKHALKPAQRLKLETEACTGEFKIEEAKKESERELQRLLGKPSTVPMSALPHPPLSTTAPTAPLSSPSHTSSRIERASYRDPVGEQIVTTTSTKCTYLSEISVIRRQFQEAGTTCVECPICGACRTLKSPKDRPHFPSHPRCLNPPRNRERRWVEQEYIWKVAED